MVILSLIARSLFFTVVTTGFRGHKVKSRSQDQGHVLKVHHQRGLHTKFEVSIFSQVIAVV